jgi:PAS domain S-box-containing protein
VSRTNESIEQIGLLTAVGQEADAVVLTDIDGKILYVNPAFTTMTGYLSTEVVGKSPRVLKSGRQPQAFYKELWKTILSGKAWHGELSNRRKDGSLYTEEMKIVPLRNPKGGLDGFMAIKQDVTERRAAYESRQFLASMVESSEDAIIALSPDGTILTWNRGAEAIFGYKAKEAIGKSWFMAVTPERRAAAKQQIDALLQGKVFAQKHAVGVRKDKQRIHISFTSWPLRNSRGEITAVSAIVRDVTRHYEAEQAQALLASIIESSDDAIYAADLDGTILSWNRGAQALLGYTGNEIIGKNAVALSTPRYRHKVPLILKTIRTGWAVGAYDTAFLRKDGREVNVSLSVSPIRNSNGEATGASVIARDITKRCEAEKAQALLASIVESSKDGISSVALDGTILSWNRGAEALMGYTHEEILGKNISLFVLPERGEKLALIMDAIGKGSSISSYDAILVAKDGSKVDVSFSISAIRNSSGEVIGVSGIARGIGQRLQIERKLVESEAQFRSVFEQAPFGICAGKLDGRFAMVNSAFCALLGYSEEELLAMTWMDLTHPEDIAPSAKLAQQLQQEPYESLEGEKRYIHHNGNVIWVYFKMSLVRNGDGDPLHYVVHAEDITKRKENENALRETNHKLEEAIIR